MQVNKRSAQHHDIHDDQIDAQISKKLRSAKDALDVEDAALKYQNAEKDDVNQDVVDTNIDSELLTQQAQAYTEAQEDNTQSYLTNEAYTDDGGQDVDVAEKSNVEDHQSNNDSIHSASQQILHQSSEKPLAGTEEWHRIRKDNHKEVERRRRENINTGIKELASLLPSPETNKSQILQRAIEYIKRLKENENNNIEKWTLEKLLSNQAVAELTASNEKLKTELERAYREVEHWKKACSISKEEK